MTASGCLDVKQYLRCGLTMRAVPDAGSTRTRPDPAVTATWRGHQVLEVDGVEFVAQGVTKRFTSSRDRFCLVKRPDLVDAYLVLLADLQPATIVELGTFQGGSCALMALAGGPDVLVSVELSEERVPALDALIAERGLRDRVHVYHAVDQADAATLSDLVDRHLAGRPLDLVVDDASHLVAPSRASFNVLFPRLRPRGVYIIEDWSWAHIGYGTHRPAETPLTVLVFEITMTLPSRPGLIAELRIDRDWAMVVRGDAELDTTAFDISTCYSERGRTLIASRRG
jgi:predicted O-methyltransferase YrrM